MFKKSHDLTVNIGTKEKPRWLPIGNLLTNPNGELRIKIDSLPATGFDGWVFCFPIRKDGENSTKKTSKEGNPSKEELLEQLKQLL